MWPLTPRSPSVSSSNSTSPPPDLDEIVRASRSRFAVMAALCHSASANSHTTFGLLRVTACVNSPDAHGLPSIRAATRA